MVLTDMMMMMMMKQTGGLQRVKRQEETSAETQTEAEPESTTSSTEATIEETASTQSWTTEITTFATEIYTSASSNRPNYFSSTMRPTTTSNPLLNTTRATANATGCAVYDNDLFWIKVGLFSAAGVCLIMLCCMSCILALVYWAYYKTKDSSESDIDANKGSKRQQQQQPPLQLEDGFKRLTVAKEDNSRLQKRGGQVRPFGANLAAIAAVAAGANNEAPKGSPSPAGFSSFSAHMAPPVPKSAAPSNSMGASPAEEAPIRKEALDRIEQEEAKRHTDMMLMNDKSLMKRVHDAVNRESSAKSKQNRSKSRSSRPSQKNPSFVVDKKTLKLVRVDGKSSKDLPGAKGAVNIPFKF